MFNKINKIKKKVSNGITSKVIKNKRTIRYRRSDNYKKDNEKIEASLVVKILSIFLIFIFCIYVLMIIFGTFSTKFAIFIWKHFIMPCRSFIFSVSQYFVFKPGTTIISPLFCGLILLIVLLFICALVEYFLPMSYQKRSKKANFYRALSLIVSCYVVFVTGFSYLNLNNPKLDTLYFNKQENNKYKLEDIIKLDEELKNKVVLYSHMMSRDSSGNVNYNGDIIDTAIEDLNSASSRYDILSGLYPRKLYAFNDSNYQNDPSTLGLTGADSVGVDYNMDSPLLINTVTHELCHTKGIVSENDAVLCSVIVGIESDNLLSNYGAYIEAFFRTNDALSLIDSEKALSHKNEIFDLCLNDHYQEICNIYRKDTNLYVKKSNAISIGTYKLKSYDKEYIYEMIDSFKENKPELYINLDKKVKKSDLDKYFEDDNAYLEIRIKNSKDDFVKVKKLLDKYSSRVRYIYQEYDGMYTGVNLTKKEAIKYYTSSIPRGNILSFTKRNEIYDYSRSVRLFLEYFDSKNV